MDLDVIHDSPVADFKSFVDQGVLGRSTLAPHRKWLHQSNIELSTAGASLTRYQAIAGYFDAGTAPSYVDGAFSDTSSVKF